MRSPAIQRIQQTRFVGAAITVVQKTSSGFRLGERELKPARLPGVAALAYCQRGLHFVSGSGVRSAVAPMTPGSRRARAF